MIYCRCKCLKTTDLICVFSKESSSVSIDSLCLFLSRLLISQSIFLAMLKESVLRLHPTAVWDTRVTLLHWHFNMTFELCSVSLKHTFPPHYSIMCIRNIYRITDSITLTFNMWLTAGVKAFIYYHSFLWSDRQQFYCI